jgi:hypothetical protein
MNILEAIQDRTIGFAHADQEDDILHQHLLTYLRGRIAPTLLLEEVREQNEPRLGEQSLAARTADWVKQHSINLLITPPRDDHPEHHAAGMVGRLTVARLRGQHYPLGLLELQAPPPRAWSEIYAGGRAGERGPDQPLTASDSEYKPRSEHRTLPPDYRWVAVGNLMIAEAPELAGAAAA